MAVKSVSTTASPYKQLFFKRLLSIPEIGVLSAVILFFLAFALADASIIQRSTLQTLAQQGTFIGLASFALSFLMITGEIDLSSGATAGLAAVVTGMLLEFLGWSEWASYGVAIGAALVVGLLNSFITLWIGMPSFFATLATNFSVAGLLVWLLNGQFIYLEGKIPTMEQLASSGPFGFPWMFCIYLLLVILGDWVMRTTKLGPILAAVGSNRRAAEIVGINVKLVKTCCFLFVSLICGIAGLFVMGYGKTADPGIGDGWLLWVVAISIIGGGSLQGGVGSIIGSFLGTLLISIIRIGLTAAHVKTNAQGIVVGVILIGAVTLDAYRRKAIKY